MAILIVEDCNVTQKILDMNIRKYGYQTEIKRTGKEALEYLNENPDTELVISDIYMPEMDGLQLLKILKANENLKNIPVMLCSATKDLDIVKAGIALGCRDYIVKPVIAGQLKQKILNILEPDEIFEI